MDLCRNITVSGGLTSECQPDQLFSSSCSKIGSLDDLFSGHNTVEGENDDVSLEWLSIFVEDCLTSSGNCLPVPGVPTNITNEVDEEKKTSSRRSSSSSAGRLSTAVLSKSQSTSSSRFDSLPSKFVIASGKGARSKRKRILVAKSKSQVISSSSWSGRHIPPKMTGCCSSVDPPLLQQTYWLADSELIFPKKDDDDDDQEGGRSRSRERSAERDGEEVVVLLEEMVGGEEEEEENKVRGKEGNNRGRVISNGQQQQQQGRRCSHCLAQRTPQWRAGPLGPKTLCNACGVRYKSGRLLPEYRPAKSPTFVSYLHSNSHKKVLEMRQSILSSHSSS